jgi:hypothetical protein
VTYYYSFIVTILAVVMAAAGIGTYWHQTAEITALSRALIFATNDKADVCTSARFQASTVLYRLRAPDVTGTDLAMQLSRWMPYCDSIRGRQLQKAIDDAVARGISAALANEPQPADVVDVIRNALLTFRGPPAETWTSTESRHP